MKRYLIAFIVTCVIYCGLLFSFIYSMNIEKRALKLNEEKNISLNHISLIQQKEVIKKEKVTKEEKPPKLSQKLKEVTTTEQKVKRKITEPLKKAVQKKKVIKKEIQVKKEVKKTQPKLIKTAIKRDYKKEYINEHLKQIVMLIQKHIHYPKRARNLQIEGEVLIEFTLTNEGISKEYKTLKGHRLLQKSTIEAIEKATPFFPRVKKSLKLIVPVRYVLT